MKVKLFGKTVTVRKRTTAGLFIAVASVALHNDAMAIPVAPDLGVAGGFGVLAGSAITITGPTTVNGDIGSFPTPAITGLGNLTLNGVNQGGDTLAATAQNDLTTAYNAGVAAPATALLGPAVDLGGLTLLGGVYNGSSSVAVTGTLTLDAYGNPNEVWIFQAGSTLLMAANSQVVLTGGAQAGNVYWLVGSSATVGADTAFEGNLLAYSAITLGAGATVDGLVAAETGAITLDNNTISVPDYQPVASVPDGSNTLILLGGGLMALGVVKRQVLRPA